MPKLLLFILLFVCSLQSFAQTDSLIDSFINKKIPLKNADTQSALIKKDTSHQQKIFPAAIADSEKIIPDSFAAKTDSLQTDSAKNTIANLPAQPAKMLNWQQDTSFTKLFSIGFKKGKITPFFMIEEPRKAEQKDALFYLAAGIVAFLGFIKLSFPKYFQNIFRLLFQSSFMQKQKRENLLQDNLPSLLLNLLFVLSGGLFITLVAINRRWIHIDFWLLFLYCTILLAVIYAGKFIFISFAGWVFRAREAAGSYISIVFLINKITGVTLVPLLLLLAFSGGEIANTAVTIAFAVCILLLAYRYILLLSFVRRNLKVNPIHFFIYLCTVEIIPMLIIYKVLFNKIGPSI